MLRVLGAKRKLDSFRCFECKRVKSTHISAMLEGFKGEKRMQRFVNNHLNIVLIITH